MKFYNSVQRFNPLYRGTWVLTYNVAVVVPGQEMFQSAISRYLVSNLGSLNFCWVHFASFNPLYRGTWVLTGGRQENDSCPALGFQSAISRYLGSDPTRETPPLTRGGGNDLHTPRRIDHIPTFASLNHDKNTRSTHYTPNAGIESSETTPPPLPVNPVQNCA